MNQEEQFVFDYMLGRANLDFALSDQVSESERREKLFFAARCFEKALDSGYVPAPDEKESEFDCRVTLALLLVEFNYQNNSDISQKGFSSPLKRAATELEKALKIDASANGQFLSDRKLAATILLCLDTLWLAKSSYIYKQSGAAAALKYLQDKSKLLEYLDGICLPGICAMLFQYWTEVGNSGIGEHYLRRSANGETFEDVASGTRFYVLSAHYKRTAQQMLTQ